MFAFISRARQDFVQLADAPARAETRAVAVLIEPACDSLDAHGAGHAVLLAEQPEHQPHDFGFDRANGEALLGFRAALPAATTA